MSHNLKTSLSCIVRYVFDDVTPLTVLPFNLRGSNSKSNAIKKGGLFQYKDHLSRYGNSHNIDKMTVRPSYFYNHNSYGCKMVYFYWKNSPFQYKDAILQA